jgi:class 3 adenylate cyclase/TolB-like protein/Flp pilus assembly protein TadD
MSTAGTEQRKLAAIMFTDMVGYSALTQRNEALALELLEQHRKLLRALFPQYQGTEIKTTGDGFLVEFASALAAVRCAIEIQRSLATRNVASATERQLQVRIGIHVGDVLHHEGDVLGDGVNIASRIESLARPGGICISVDVERQIRNAIDASLVKLGPTELKNIKLPMELYRVGLPWEKDEIPADAGKGVRAATEPKSRRFRPVASALLVLALAGIIALAFKHAKPESVAGGLAAPRLGLSAALEKTRIILLPLQSRGRDEADAGFAGGMTEALRGKLSRISGLHIFDGTLLANIQDEPPDLARKCRELNVGSVLRGSVQQIGSQLRVHLELLNSQTAEVLWPYEEMRQFKDIFAVQSEVAQGIASAVKVQLLPLEKQELRRKPTENLEAYKLFLQGRYLWNRRTATSLTNAIEYFNQAIGRDPGYAVAYAGLADCHVLGGYAGLPPHETMPKARAAALKALELDNTAAEPHATLARIKALFDWDWVGAEAEFRRAIELNPNYATAHHWFSDMLTWLGRFDEALEEIKRAQEIDPLSPIINAMAGSAFFAAGDEVLAVEILQKQIDLDPSFTMAHMKLGEVYLRKGKSSEAIAELETAHRLEGGGTYALETLALIYGRAGRTNDAQKVLGQIVELQGQGLDHRVAIALVEHLLGDDAHALNSLEKAVNEHADGLENLYADSFWKDLRPNLRFQAILRRMNLVK